MFLSISRVKWSGLVYWILISICSCYWTIRTQYTEKWSYATVSALSIIKKLYLYWVTFQQNWFFFPWIFWKSSSPNLVILKIFAKRVFFFTNLQSLFILCCRTHFQHLGFLNGISTTTFKMPLCTPLHLIKNTSKQDYSHFTVFPPLRHCIYKI